MKIFIDNVNLNSSSGPNGFAKKISNEFKKTNSVFTSVQELIESKEIPDIQLSFIAAQQKMAPLIQRLDGQDFNRLNIPIENTYAAADAVVFQSNFNKILTEKYFGIHKNSYIISNGTCLDSILKIDPMKSEILDRFENVWMCASSWRPHKRLKDNIDYFLKMSDKNDCLVIAGENPDFTIQNSRIFYSGHLTWKDMISLMKRSKYFIHLAWLDHCPNVVIDARASGCHIICSSSGGTKEISGKNSTIIIEEEWDYSPVELYSPPKMDYLKSESGLSDSEINIKEVSKKYIDVFLRTKE